jgi:gluconolactonase
VWTSVPGGGRLLYSDIPQDAVFEWTPKEPATDKPGPGSQLVKPSGNSNGLIIGPDNVVIAAAHAGRLAIVFPADKARTLVDKHDGKSLNSPNDLCAGPDGSIYFTDPPYGLRGSLGPAGGRTRELDFCGVYRLAPDGALTLLNKSLRTPNGLAFSPDDKTLYVADTSGGKIHAFDVKPDGSLGEARVFAEVMNGKTGKSGGPDGVKVDASGHVLCAAGDGIHMFDASGKHLGTIATPKGATNLCFGGEKNDWLFITASSDVYRVQMATPGRKLQTPKIPPFK